jgi:Mor family transcriptional regulator
MKEKYIKDAKLTSVWESEIAEVIGRESLYKLEEAMGAQFIYVPARKPSKELVDAIGQDAAKAIVDHFGYGDIYVPRNLYRAVRNKKILAEHKNAGRTAKELAAKFKLKTATIKVLLAERNKNNGCN